MGGYLLYLFANGGPGNLIDVKSATDGEVYAVQDLPNKQKAADMLAQIKANMQKVAEYYKQPEFAPDKPAQLLVQRFNPENIMENSMTSSDTSYSENKGEKIVLCLRDKTHPPDYPFVPLNTVMFVVLHEMAHPFFDALPPETKTILRQLHAQEMQSKTGPLFDAEGQLTTDLYVRAEDFAPARLRAFQPARPLS
jgi:hypothetical protein